MVSRSTMSVGALCVTFLVAVVVCHWQFLNFKRGYIWEETLYMDTALPSNRESDVRSFRGHGCAAYSFVEFGAYRGGNRTFSVVGLGSKSLHSYGNPRFSCEWISAGARDEPVNGTAVTDQPDYGYGHVYTVVIITCSFDSDVGTDGKGGELILDAYQGDEVGSEERIVVLIEKPGHYNASIFNPPYPFDFIYCGSPLFGHINPHRVREWISYHNMVFGEKSHFVLYDAGGIHEAVRKVLEPWIQLGRVSIQNIRSTTLFDGYYYNQFLIVNDCVQRSKFVANWTFFFDLDEYIYVEPPQTLHSLLADRQNATQVIFRQFRMVRNVCSLDGANSSVRGEDKQWGFEKMTFRDLYSTNHDVKYVCNPRKVWANGVHGVQNPGAWGETMNDTIARYYHYHATLAMTDKICKDHLDKEATGYDGTMVPLAHQAQRSEFEALGANQDL